MRGGSEWVRVKLRPGVTQEDLDLFWRTGGYFDRNLWGAVAGKPPAGADEWAVRRFQSEHERLWSVFEFPDSFTVDRLLSKRLTDRGEPGGSARLPADVADLSIIEDNPVFPREWQEAPALILPGDLPLQTHRWAAYLDAVRAGRFAGYLYRRFRYENLDYGMTFPRFLLWRAQTLLQERRDAWPQSAAFGRVRDLLLKAPLRELRAVTLTDPPTFDPDGGDEPIDHEDVTAHEKSLRNRGRVAELVRSWNEVAPQSWKIDLFQVRHPDFQEFIDRHANDDRLLSFLAWCDHLAADGAGLLAYDYWEE